MPQPAEQEDDDDVANMRDSVYLATTQREVNIVSEPR
jgi:hypothetical protein